MMLLFWGGHMDGWRAIVCLAQWSRQTLTKSIKKNGQMNWLNKFNSVVIICVILHLWILF